MVGRAARIFEGGNEEVVDVDVAVSHISYCIVLYIVFRIEKKKDL